MNNVIKLKKLIRLMPHEKHQIERAEADCLVNENLIPNMIQECFLGIYYNSTTYAMQQGPGKWLQIGTITAVRCGNVGSINSAVK